VTSLLLPYVRTPTNASTDTRDKLVVAAIDFGTTYSGYAFSFKSDYNQDKLKIFTNSQWSCGEKVVTSYKTPTSLLLDGSLQFVAFGHEAERRYMEMEQTRFSFNGRR